MKNFRRLSVIASLLLIVFAAMSFLPKTHLSEVKYQAKTISILIKGTSTLHDWEMKSNEGKCDVVFVIGPNNKLTSVSGLNFTLPAKSLKSGHNMMDNNTYKALKTDAFSNIGFVLSSANVTQVDAFNYQLKCIGKLTIAGATRETELLATGKINPADNSLTISGSKKMKMTEYNVKPPTVMMGSIKTGDDISIVYTLKLTH
jgi:polyisoprenoid-binding protein YceI